MEKVHFKSKLVGKHLRFFTDKNVRSNHIHMNNPVMIDARGLHKGVAEDQSTYQGYTPSFLATLFKSPFFIID